MVGYTNFFIDGAAKIDHTFINIGFKPARLDFINAVNASQFLCCFRDMAICRGRANQTCQVIKLR